MLFPVNRYYSLFRKIAVALTEMLVAKEAFGSRKRRGVDGFQHKVP
jgi:hypothetical protein